MAVNPAPSVVLLSAPGTLAGVDPLLRRGGARPVRLVSQESQPVPPMLWLERLERRTALDTVVVTSRAAVSAGVRPWRRATGPFPPSLEFWAVGPKTAQALQQAGIRGVHRPRTVGASAIAKSLGRGRRRRVVYFRSDMAGPGLAQALRSRGHRVLDLVVYRLGATPRLTATARRELARAGLLVVTSPSGLSGLRRRLDRTQFSRLARTARLVVLGERSRRAARALGFRHVSVAPVTTAQRFTRHLFRELQNGRR